MKQQLLVSKVTETSTCFASEVFKKLCCFFLMGPGEAVIITWIGNKW